MLSSNLDIEIYLITKSKRTKTKKRTHKQPAHSFVKQWAQNIKATWQYAAETSVKDTGGTLRSAGYTGFRCDATAALLTRGIIAGTGNTPVAIDDYRIETLIPHGTGSGQLSYREVVIDPFEVVGSVARFRIRRQLENLSGATITTKEVALYAYNASGYTFLLARDVLTTPQDILNGQVIEIRYVFKATV